MNDEEKNDKKWKERLTSNQYHILREKGTEPPFTGEYVKNKRKGEYKCAACGATLFQSDKKFDSGTGWPSFWAPASNESVKTKGDATLFMKRTEILCSRCGGHLGHVFDDGPAPTGQRYCVNSAALAFEEDKD